LCDWLHWSHSVRILSRTQLCAQCFRMKSRHSQVRFVATFCSDLVYACMSAWRAESPAAHLMLVRLAALVAQCSDTVAHSVVRAVLQDEVSSLTGVFPSVTMRSNNFYSLNRCMHALHADSLHAHSRSPLSCRCVSNALLLQFGACMHSTRDLCNMLTHRRHT
jgi:hypothetical protein